MKADTRTIVFVLAGGRGDRLDPLTRRRAKPAVPFGGVYRIIDFTLSNCFNSGLESAYILTQHNRESLHDYLTDSPDTPLACVPPANGRSYRGTADAVYQNLSLLEQQRPDYVLILSADHIYKMDYSHLLRFHQNTKADATVAAVEYSRRMGSRFGILEVDAGYRIVSFDEKPEIPKAIPGKPDSCLASMGIYVFNAHTLRKVLAADAARIDSAHDFGRDVLPHLIFSHQAFAFRFEEGSHGTAPYWRDVGTIDAYYRAHMDLLLVNSPFDSYDDARWPIRAFGGPTRDFSPLGNLYSELEGQDSFVSPGASVHGRVFHSIISPDVAIDSSTEIRDSILMQGVRVGKGSRIRRTIVEDNVYIPEHAEIGYDGEKDQRFFHVTEAGVVVVPAGASFPFNVCSERPITVQTDPMGCRRAFANARPVSLSRKGSTRC